MDNPIWWKPPYECKNCGKDITIVRIAINSNSQVLLEGVCILCGKEAQGVITFDRDTIRNLIELDMMSTFETLVDDREEHDEFADGGM